MAIARRSVQVARIATRGLGSTDDTLHVRDFVEGEIYQIDDLHPWLHFGIDVEKKPDLADTEPGFLDKAGALGDDLTWSRWCPLSKKESTVSADRRFGYYEVELRGSWQARLRCYVWPARLFDRVQMGSMIRTIGHELGRTIVWERTESPVRAYATGTAGGRVELRSLLERTSQELHAIELLQRTYGSAEDSQRAHLGDGEGSPEEQLVALWGLRRLRQLNDYKQRLERATAEHKEAIWDYARNVQRVDAHKQGLEAATSELRKVTRTASLVRGVTERYAHVRAALELVPSMQRDYRLRRLLRAFNTPVNEWLADRVTNLSTLPPIKAPELFELWGAVRIVHALRALGWNSSAPALRGAADAWGVSALDGCSWRFVNGLEQVVFDFGPRPRVVDMSSIPAMQERKVDAWMWAAHQITPHVDTLFSLHPSTPDYALRWSSDSRQGLLIGDASLADPRHQKGTKVEKVCDYRREVAWLTHGSRVVTCGLRGSFILLPGPSSQWADAVRHAAQHDCYALCPEPGATEDPELVEMLRHMLDGLRNTGSHTDRAVERVR